MSTTPSTVCPPESPATFALAVSNGRWRRARHLDLLDRALVWLDQREAPRWFLRQLGGGGAVALPSSDPADYDLLPFTRLIIEMPPRHGKSELTSRYFPAWYLGRHPDHRVILASYEATYARSWGRKARELIKTHGPQFFGVSLKRKSEAANDWEIEGSDGGMITAGVGGAITGRGAQALLIDDPVKNSDEAASPTIQERNLDWWRSTASTRLEPDEAGRAGIVVLIMTRWHERDLAGAILAQTDDDDEEERWIVLRLPALAEQGDPLARAEGEPLWPERFSLRRLTATMRRIGAYFWSALYQQRPTPESGGIFDRTWWRRYHARDLDWRNLRGGSFVDTAQTINEGSDYSAIGTWVTDGKEAWLLHMVRGRWTFPELVTMCMQERETYSLPVYVEAVPWANPLIQTLENMVAGVVPFKPQGHAKVERARAVSPYAQAGNLWIPYEGEWLVDWIDEHAAFPNGAHDDQCDTTSMMGLVFWGEPDWTAPLGSMEFVGREPATIRGGY